MKSSSIIPFGYFFDQEIQITRFDVTQISLKALEDTFILSLPEEFS